MFCKIVLFLKHIILGIIRGSRKLLCFRKRQPNPDANDEPTSILVVGPTINFTSESSNNDAPQWESWDNEGFSGEPQIAQPPSHLSDDGLIEDENAQENFFKDMEPKVRVKKIYVRKNNTEAPASRLLMNQDLDFTTTGELESWDDGGGGWEEDNVDEKQALREMGERKRMERLMRNEQLRNNRIKHERLATKVS